MPKKPKDKPMETLDDLIEYAAQQGYTIEFDSEPNQGRRVKLGSPNEELPEVDEPCA